MASVIERLRVQGGAPPGCAPTFVRSHAARLSNRRTASTDAKTEEKDNGRIHIGPTPMVRRVELVSTFRDPTMGLPSVGFPGVSSYQDIDSSTDVSFVLSGTAVNDSSRKMRSNTAGCKLNRAGNYKTTPKELYRVSHGISLKDGSEPLPFGHGIHACYDPEMDEISRATLRTAKSTRSHIDLHDLRGAPSAVSNMGLVPPSTAPATSYTRPVTTLELTGQRFSGKTPDEFSFYDSHILEDSCFPYLRSPRRSMRFPRSSGHSFQTDSFAKFQELQDCLKINKSTLPRSGKNGASVTRDEGESKTHAEKLKYENVKKNLRRYEFKNLGSYLRFSQNQHEQPNAVSKPRLAHIPRGVISLPEPWAETVLLKLMRDLHPPHSRMSSARYSDIGHQEDMDAFFVIGSPTSLDKHSQLVAGQKSSGTFRKNPKSVKNAFGSRAGDKIDEEDTAVNGPEMGGNQTTRTDSSVDHNDLEDTNDLGHQNEVSESVFPEIAVSVNVIQAAPKAKVAHSDPSNVNSTTPNNSDDNDGLAKIIVPVENTFCGDNDSFAIRDSCQVQENANS